MSKYPFPNLSKKQKQILDALGCGNYSLKYVMPTKKSIEGLLEKGLIRSLGFITISGVKIPEYEMPIAVHLKWCEYQSTHLLDAL